MAAGETTIKFLNGLYQQVKMRVLDNGNGEYAQIVGITGSIPGNTLEEQLSEADLSGGNLTFSADITYVEIVNRDTANVGTFTVNGVVITVDPQVAYGPVAVNGTASATVAVSGSTSFLVSRYT